MGVGRSPVRISEASWYSAATAHFSGSGPGSPRISRRMSPKAWASTATWWECSWIFSEKVLRMRPHRVM